jgi:hypothetical protein
VIATTASSNNLRTPAWYPFGSHLDAVVQPQRTFVSSSDRGARRSRPRLTITETDDIAAALDIAAARWPEVQSRRELLLRLVEQDREVIENERDDAVIGGGPRSGARAVR